MLLGGLEASLRLFRQQPRDHPHGQLDGNLTRPALLELLAEPAVNLLVTGLEADGDLFQHLHQRFCRHRAPPIYSSPKAYGLPSRLLALLLVLSPPTHSIILCLVRLRSCRRATVPKSFRLIGARPDKGNGHDRGRIPRLACRIRHRLAGIGLAIMPPVRCIAEQQVHVDVIVVEAVRARAEYGIKLIASAGEDRLQEGPLARRAAPPAIDHGDVLAVRQPEPRYIE